MTTPENSFDGSPYHPGNRARWLASEGTALFRELGERVLDGSHRRLSNKRITETIRTVPGIYGPVASGDFVTPILAAQTVSGLLADQLAWKRNSLLPTPDTGLQKRLNFFTHDGVRPRLLGGIDDGILSTTNLPTNLLYFANQQAVEEGRKPIFRSVKDIGLLYKKPWLHAVAHTAAFTVNGAWKSSSTWRIDQVREADLADFSEISGELFDFEILDTPDGTTFDLSQNSKQVLVDALRQHNKEVRQLLLKGVIIGKAHSYSSGCPVVHNMPRFNQSGPDQERLEELSDYLKISPEKITQRREQTVINKSMFAVSRLLARAVKLAPDNEIMTGKRAA